MTVEVQPQTCGHCGRTDVGTRGIKAAEVDVPVRDPATMRIIGTETIVACDPRKGAAYADITRWRPRCAELVTVYSHPQCCALCARSNPPDAENRWATEDKHYDCE